MHSKHSKKKSFFPLKLLLGIVLTAAVCLGVFFGARAILGSRDGRDKVQKEAETAVPELTPEPTPEPVDLREYDISLPEGLTDGQKDALEALQEQLTAEFCSRHDGSEPAKLTVSYEQGGSQDVLSFLLSVSDGENDSITSLCLDADGNPVSPETLWGIGWEDKVLEFVNITAFTSDSYLNDNGVLILNHDISDAVSRDNAPLSLYLIQEDGSVEFRIPADAIREDAVYSPCEEACPFITVQTLSAEPSEEMTEEAVIEAPEEDGNAFSEENPISDPLAPDAAEVPPTEEVTEVQEVSEIPAEEPAPETAAEDEAVADASTEAEETPEEPAERLPVPAFDENGSLIVFANHQIFSGKFSSIRKLYPFKPMVAITFDDGPSATTTPQILECLQENGAVATFFEVGRNVVGCPEVLQMELDAGCEIGCHSYNHINLMDTGADGAVYDKALADQVFMDAIGFTPTVYRPPEGVTGYGLYSYSEPFIGWSKDTLDWLYKNTSQIVKYVQTCGSLDGQVILMHSIYDTTVAAVREIVPWIKDQGYQMVTIDELFEYFYEIEPESHYYYADVVFWNGKRPEHVEEAAEVLPEVEETPQI